MSQIFTIDTEQERQSERARRTKKEMLMTMERITPPENLKGTSLELLPHPFTYIQESILWAHSYVEEQDVDIWFQQALQLSFKQQAIYKGRSHSHSIKTDPNSLLLLLPILSLRNTEPKDA